MKGNQCQKFFLAIFRNEVTTVLTPSTLEGGEWAEVEVLTSSTSTGDGGGGADGHVFRFGDI